MASLGNTQQKLRVYARVCGLASQHIQSHWSAKMVQLIPLLKHRLGKKLGGKVVECLFENGVQAELTFDAYKRLFEGVLKGKYEDKVLARIDAVMIEYIANQR